ncbi:MAG: polysaccharide deacetylase family protein [Verrucomicrobiota bacterium]
MIGRVLNWLKRRRHEAEQAKLLACGPCLKVLLFHGIYDDMAGPCPGDVEPSLMASLSWVEQCILETQKQGFTFIHAKELPEALKSTRRVALFTLDDGCANNLLLRPLLNRLKVPCVLFVTTDALLRKRCYWWDVLVREAGNTPGISQKRRALKKLKPAEIDAQLVAEYGEAAFTPRGDHDRPMTVEELCEFASDPLITIGNHTHRHALLDQLTASEVREELSTCGQALQEILGTRPDMLGYPNGRWSQETVAVTKQAGIKLAFTTSPALAPLPLDPSRWHSIPRFQPMPKS